MVNNFYLGSLLCKIELESVSAAVRLDNKDKVHSFLEKDLLLIL